MRTILLSFLITILFCSCGEEPNPLVENHFQNTFDGNDSNDVNDGGSGFIPDKDIPTLGEGSSEGTIIDWRAEDDAGFVTLHSTRDYNPSTWDSGLYFLNEPLKIFLPHQILVTSGRAGSHYFFIELQTSEAQGILPQQIRCFYRGIGNDKFSDYDSEENKDYYFSFCMDATESFSVKTLDKYKETSFNLLIEPGIHNNPIYMEVGDNIKGHIDNANYRSSPRERVPTSTETQIDLER